jgi:hypothetical protein
MIIRQRKLNFFLRNDDVVPTLGFVWRWWVLISSASVDVRKGKKCYDWLLYRHVSIFFADSIEICRILNFLLTAGCLDQSGVGNCQRHSRACPRPSRLLPAFCLSPLCPALSYFVVRSLVPLLKSDLIVWRSCLTFRFIFCTPITSPDLLRFAAL